MTVPQSSTMASAKKKAKQSIAVDSEKNRLLSIWDLVSEELSAKVRAGDEETIEFLAKTFPTAKYPAKGSASAHCVFCHKTFDPRLPGKCYTEHEWGEGERYQKWPPRYSYFCSRCEASEDVEEDDCPDGCCREGVCSEDISERMSENWHLSYGDDNDDFDECAVCIELKARYDEDDEEDDEEENVAEEEDNKAAPEVIVIDD